MLPRQFDMLTIPNVQLMEEDFTIEAYYTTDQQNDQVSDQRVMLPHTRLRAVFDEISSTHSSPTEVSVRFKSHEDVTALLSGVSPHSVSRVDVQFYRPKTIPHPRLSNPRRKRKRNRRLLQYLLQVNLKQSHSK